VDHKSVEAFLNAEPKPSWDGKELLIMSKEAYVEMKIKEKGLKGKAAIVKRDHITRKGFDAFREMRMAAAGKGGKKEERAEPEIFVAFLGKKIRVLEGDGGCVAPEEVPRVRGSTLRFTGCGGEVSYEDIKRPLKERFNRAPFVKFTKGEDMGLVGFDKALDTEDIAFVKEKLPTLNGKPVTWDLPEGSSILYFSVSNAGRPTHNLFDTQKRKSTHLRLSGPTRRRSAHWGMRAEVLVEVVEVGLLAGGVVAVVGGQIEALMPRKVETVAKACRVAGMSRLGRSARGR
jgi:lupus La protein